MLISGLVSERERRTSQTARLLLRSSFSEPSSSTFRRSASAASASSLAAFCENLSFFCVSSNRCSVLASLTSPARSWPRVSFTMISMDCVASCTICIPLRASSTSLAACASMACTMLTAASLSASIASASPRASSQRLSAASRSCCARESLSCHCSSYSSQESRAPGKVVCCVD